MRESLSRLISSSSSPRRWSVVSRGRRCAEVAGTVARPDGHAVHTRRDGLTADLDEKLREAAPLDIIAFVGDNILDFPRLTQAVKAGGEPAFADFGIRYFIIPNPMYGSWQ